MEIRIQKIINKHNFSLSAFAKEIGVSRSAISHILTGRNNPSVEVLQKILKRFPNLSADWLLLGNGDMYSQITSEKSSYFTTFFTEKSSDKIAEKVVVFYSDYTFKEYKPC